MATIESDLIIRTEGENGQEYILYPATKGENLIGTIDAGSVKLLLKRGLKANMPALGEGEIAFATDEKNVYVGTADGNVSMGGNQWIVGTNMSGTSSTANYYSYSACPEVKEGDLYLNKSYGYVYKCTTAGSGSTAKWTYQSSIKGATGAKGDRGYAGNDGVGISSITQTTNNTGSGEANNVQVALTDGSVSNFTVYNGSAGVGISSIVQTTDNKGSGEANTIKITLTDGSTQTFTVYNGAAGSGSGGGEVDLTTEYGIRWAGNITERVVRKDGVIKAGEETGLTFTVEEDGSFTSSFDSIYPWSGMERVTLQEQAMVKVPKYYICCELIDGYYYMWVCGSRLNDSYRCAAIFLQADGVTENDYYYIGAYESTPRSPGQSVSGVAYNYPDNPDWGESAGTYKGYTITQYRDRAKQLGDGWGITTIAEVGDFWQVLLPIEFGTRDVQSVAAGVCCLLAPPIDDCSYYDNNTQQNITYSTSYRTGMCDGVAKLNGIASVYSDNPAHQNLISAGLTEIAEEFRYNGQTGLNCGANPFVYRGIENPYGCTVKYVDGLVWYDGTFYVSNDKSVFRTDDVTGYTSVEIGIPAENGFVYGLGRSVFVLYLTFPTSVSQSTGEGFCDYSIGSIGITSIVESYANDAQYGGAEWNGYLIPAFGGGGCCMVQSYDGTYVTTCEAERNGVWNINYINPAGGYCDVSSRLSYTPPAA